MLHATPFADATYATLHAADIFATPLLLDAVSCHIVFFFLLAMPQLSPYDAVDAFSATAGAMLLLPWLQF